MQTHIAIRLDHIKSTLSCDFFVNNAEIDTIVVKKLLTHDANALAAWETALRDVGEELDRFDRAKLKKLVGSRDRVLGLKPEGESYDSIETMLKAPLFEMPPVSQPDERRGSGPAPAAPLKMGTPAKTEMANRSGSRKSTPAGTWRGNQSKGLQAAPSSPSSPSRVLAPRSANFGPPRGVKRKVVEVIDLTLDGD